MKSLDFDFFLKFDFKNVAGVVYYRKNQTCHAVKLRNIWTYKCGQSALIVLSNHTRYSEQSLSHKTLTEFSVHSKVT